MLGAAVHRGGVPSPALRRRIVRGVAAFQAGRAESLIVTGGMGRHAPTEAEVMSRIAREMGVPEAAIVVERQARNTHESARICSSLMRRRGWRRALIVTDGWHLARSLLAFRAYGIEAEGDSAGGGRDEVGYPLWLQYAAREALGYAWYAMRLRRRLVGLAPQDRDDEG